MLPLLVTNHIKVINSCSNGVMRNILFFLFPIFPFPNPFPNHVHDLRVWKKNKNLCLGWFSKYPYNLLPQSKFQFSFLQTCHRSRHSFIAFSTYKLTRSSYLSKIASFLLLYRCIMPLFVSRWMSNKFLK